MGKPGLVKSLTVSHYIVSGRSNGGEGGGFPALKINCMALVYKAGRAGYSKGRLAVPVAPAVLGTKTHSPVPLGHCF